MDQTTQSPPEAAKTETEPKPLPVEESDFHTRRSRTETSGFRIAIVIGDPRLAGGGIFRLRYMTSYESTDDAQVDGHINSISARIPAHVIKLDMSGQSICEGRNPAGGNRSGGLSGGL